MAPFDIAVLIGSLRRESITRRIANAFMALGPPSLSFREVDLGALAIYNADLEADPPAPWRAFRESIALADGLLFFTPEYNRSTPGVLKTAIDVGSRPAGKSVWNGKPAGVVSVTSGALGAFGANHHLRQSLVYVNVLTMAQPEAYIARAASLLDADGLVIDDTTRAFFARFMDSYAAWVARLVPPPERP